MANFENISNGKHGENSNAFCEHCYTLEKGIELYMDGCTWCRACMIANGWTDEKLNDMRDNGTEYDDTI